MNKFYMMIGLPGSGKSTYAQKLIDDNTVLVSSDEVRASLLGDETDQSDNQAVFDTMYRMTAQALANCNNVVYDATNLSSKKRRTLLKNLAKYDCEKIAVFMATPYKICLKQNSERTRKVPEYAIKRMYESFTVPCKQEGFNDVKIVYPEGLFFEDYIVQPVFMKWIEHDNPHHTASIGVHMMNAFNELVNYDYDEATGIATMIHDIGKPFTKSFTSYKGEPTEVAHYYNHNNVGAYDSFFLNVPENLKIEVALLIQYHMNYFTSWKDSAKAKERDKNFLGEALFAKLEILHKCDLAAH